MNVINFPTPTFSYLRRRSRRVLRPVQLWRQARWKPSGPFTPSLKRCAWAAENGAREHVWSTGRRFRVAAHDHDRATDAI